MIVITQIININGFIMYKQIIIPEILEYFKNLGFTIDNVCINWYPHLNQNIM